MLKVWVGLEARKFLQASAESVSLTTFTYLARLCAFPVLSDRLIWYFCRIIQVEMCVKYDQLSPNF